MAVFYVLIIGYVVLVFAIAANGIAKKIKVTTWYDFLSFKKRPSLLHMFWLFLVYPLILGLSATVAYRLLF